MKRIVLSAVLTIAISAPAFAADLKPIMKAPPPPPPAPNWDIAFGGIVQSDYNFRGISQSNRGPSGGAYFEPQFTLPFGTLYVGLAAWAIDWPAGFTDGSIGFSDPTAEVNFYGGWRGVSGPVSLDVGLIYYYYPKEQFNIDSDFLEIYAKLGYDFGNGLTVGGNVFYTPDMLNYGALFAPIGAGNADAVYASFTAKWVLPWNYGDHGAYISGELGHWWIDDSGFIASGLFDPSYTYYNVGLAFTYKALTLDLRYHGNDLSTAECGSFLLVGTPHPSNKWCKDTFVVGLKFDTTLSSLK